jgi:PAS domain S-box-containing protein
MTGQPLGYSIAMSPGEHVDETAALRDKLADLHLELVRQKQRLASSESRFRLLADAAPLMIWMSGEDGLCTFFNRAWLEFRGRPLEDETGNGWVEGVHPEDRELCLETYLKSFSTRKPFRMQFRLQRENGQYRWVETSGMPRYDGPGEFAGFMGTATDIDDRKHGIFTPDETAVRMILSLTERERQVLALVAIGKSTRDAAKELGISYKTCDSHRSRILEKLGVHETASLVRYAIRSGLIEP